MFTVTLCICIPTLILFWSMVVLGIRWRRGGPQPPRFMLRNLRTDRRVAFPSLMAGMMTWNLVLMPGMPWHHAVADRLASYSPWFWWGCIGVAWALPVVVARYLTRPLSAAQQEDVRSV